MSEFFPGRGPTASEFWKRRPGGPKFTLNPLKMDAYDVGWAIAHLGATALWHYKTGLGVSANMFFGEIFFPTPVTVVGRHAHTFGASPTFTSGLFQSNSLRTALRAGNRIAAPLSAAYVFHHGVTAASRKLGLYEMDTSSGSFERDLIGLGIGYDNL